MNAIDDLLRQSRVLDLGPMPAPQLAPDATVDQALQLLVRGRRGAVVAVEGDQPVGIFTERDVLYRLSGGLLTSRKERNLAALRDVMSKPAVCIGRRESLLEAIETMDKLAHRHLVVVDRQGALRGLLTTNDLVQYLTDQFPEEVVNLPPRLHQRFGRVDGA